MRVAGPHLVVHNDTALQAKLQPGIPRQLTGGQNTDAQQRIVHSRPGAVAGPDTADMSVFGLQGFHPGAKMDMDTVTGQHLQHGSREAFVQKRQQPGHHLEQMHLHAAVGQLLCHFQPDEAAADDGSLPVRAGLDRAFQPDAVLYGTKRINAICIYAGECRHNGTGTGGDHQLVVRLFPALAAVQIPDRDRSGCAVDSGHLVVDEGGDPSFVGHLIHIQAYQIVRLPDETAHKVRQAAGTVADVAGALEYGDLQRGIDPLRLGSGAQTGRCAADDDHFFSHDRTPFVWFAVCIGSDLDVVVADVILLNDAHLGQGFLQVLQLCTGVVLIGLAQVASGQTQQVQSRLDDDGVENGS